VYKNILSNEKAQLKANKLAFEYRIRHYISTKNFRSFPTKTAKVSRWHHKLKIIIKKLL